MFQTAINLGSEVHKHIALKGDYESPACNAKYIPVGAAEFSEGCDCLPIYLTAPLSLEDVKSLHAGDSVLLSGVVYTARDAAHERMAKAVETGEPLPITLSGQTLYYAGPTPTPPGKAVGAIGPTTSTRMDAYTPLLLSLGLRAMIGKGKRSPSVVAAMREHPAVYFAAIGGAAALMAECVTACEVVAYEDLGTESIKRLTLKDLPLIVAVDCYGGDYYELGQQRYRDRQ